MSADKAAGIVVTGLQNDDAVIAFPLNTYLRVMVFHSLPPAVVIIVIIIILLFLSRFSSFCSAVFPSRNGIVLANNTYHETNRYIFFCVCATRTKTA